LLRAFAPDLLVGASDAPHIILGGWLAERLSVPFAIDLYDHFESFGLSRLPGVIALYRRALRRAAVVTCVSEPLADLIRTSYRVQGKVLALPSTIDRNIFYPRDRRACRNHFGLPEDAKLFGTAGGLSRDKGIEPLYRAFERLAKNDPSVHLVLAGSLDRHCLPPEGSRVHYLGKLPHSRTADLFSALDVAVVYLRDTPYGRYSFPQKLYEMAACGVPLAVAKVGAMNSLFYSTEQTLYEPDDVESLINSLRSQMAQPEIATLGILDWGELAGHMEEAYLGCIGTR
jgi:glycosyltransferase involved in cell wall biosynthesis